MQNATYQVALTRCELNLQWTPGDVVLIANRDATTALASSATKLLKQTSITTTDLIKNVKDPDESTIRLSNAYYAQFGADYSVENLAWSADRILNTCDNALRDKVREGLVGVSELESEGPLVLKKMLDIVMNVDDSALRSLTEAL